MDYLKEEDLGGLDAIIKKRALLGQRIILKVK